MHGETLIFVTVQPTESTIRKIVILVSGHTSVHNWRYQYNNPNHTIHTRHKKL